MVFVLSAKALIEVLTKGVRTLGIALIELLTYTGRTCIQGRALPRGKRFVFVLSALP